jgi:phosphoadenosine phosphosulfate reductase
MKTSVDYFGTHAPKTEWLQDFFSRKNEFFRENSLGPDQKTRFKRFLKAADLIEEDSFSPFAEKLLAIGWDSEAGLGLLLANLAYNPQFLWYIKNLEIEHMYSRQEVVDKLKTDGNSEITSKIVTSAFKRLCELPLGTKLNFGTVTEKGRQIETLTRGRSTLEDNRVVLYSLYKFAEACKGYYQFTLTRLLDHTVESAGISPTQIFGFDRDDMERFLNGLSARYPEFINATFTHDLDKITLREDKKSTDVLSLF